MRSEQVGEILTLSGRLTGPGCLCLSSIPSVSNLWNTGADAEYSCVVATMAQGFYSWRIWSLTNRRLWLPILFGCVSCLQRFATSQAVELTCGQAMLTQMTAAFYTATVVGPISYSTHIRLCIPAQMAVGGRSVSRLFALSPEVTVRVLTIPGISTDSPAQMKGLAQRECRMRSAHNSFIGLRSEYPSRFMYSPN
jgi:hypothetical protein